MADILLGHKDNIFIVNFLSKLGRGDVHLRLAQVIGYVSVCVSTRFKYWRFHLLLAKWNHGPYTVLKKKEVW